MDIELAQALEENAKLKTELKTAYRKGMRHMAKALKDYDRTDGAWTDYFEHTVDKVLQREQLDFEEYGTLADQLTKAKEIIKAFLDSSLFIVAWLTTFSRMSCMSASELGLQMLSLMVSMGNSLMTCPSFISALMKRGFTIFPPLAMAL